MYLLLWPTGNCCSHGIGSDWIEFRHINLQMGWFVGYMCTNLGVCLLNGTHTCAICNQ